jgi:hypothetical protein
MRSSTSSITSHNPMLWAGSDREILAMAMAVALANRQELRRGRLRPSLYVGALLRGASRHTLPTPFHHSPSELSAAAVQANELNWIDFIILYKLRYRRIEKLPARPELYKSSSLSFELSRRDTNQTLEMKGELTLV